MLKPLNEENEKYIDVYRSLEKYKQFMRISEKLWYLREDFRVLNSYALDHLIPVNVLLFRAEFYHDLDKCWNSNRMNLLRGLKPGDVFSFDKVSWWSASYDYVDNHIRSFYYANKELPGTAWIYIYLLEQCKAASLEIFSTESEYLIPDGSFTVSTRDDYPELFRTVFLLKQHKV